jgi:uncharacterized protein
VRDKVHTWTRTNDTGSNNAVERTQEPWHSRGALSAMTADFAIHVALNPVNRAILSRWDRLDLPDCWLVAGCLFQTVWNVQAGLTPESGIKDYDIFYFDPSDLSEAAEAEAQVLVESLLGDLGVTVEVANQARVHIWYPTHFGYPYPALKSVEDGISRFLVRETCVGIRPRQSYAPYGLSGLYAGTLTRNPATPYPELFARKVASYRERWNWLKVEHADGA